MICRRRALALLGSTVFAVQAWADTGPSATTLRVKSPESGQDVRDSYFRALLQIALDLTAQAHGPASIKPEAASNQARAELSLQRGELDVIWVVPNEEREAMFRPIRIPLEKGLLGHRVFLIRRADQERFSAITQVDVLKALKAGQGHDWQSTKVLQANGFNVVTQSSYDAIFRMLEAGLVDYFPRGLNEAWAELDARQSPVLMVETSLLLRYPATSYFFVRQSDAALAERIEAGLRLAIDTGVFETVFLNHPAHHAIFSTARLGRRRVFALQNPYLPSTAPTGDPRLWFDSTRLS